jgi:hypothetical protein
MIWDIQNYRKDDKKKDDHESSCGDLSDFLCGRTCRSWLCASFESSNLKDDIISFLV